ncbi:MAG TPA: PBP1A family penicillin-binding protein [Stellaceae bacterium]|jgi:penicillin-binding protein 1A
MIRLLHTLTRVIFILVVLVVVVGGAGAGAVFAYYGRNLPSLDKLDHYVPAVGTKIYAGDGTLLADFAAENRIFVPIGKIPKVVKDAFISAEDHDFYSHKGVNPAAVMRAAATDLFRLHHGERPIGASTITQQVVRHFLLTNEVSISRKIKEILLAYRINSQLSKDRILEIYLNETYLGAGAYGVAAAAKTYFGKTLDQLSVAQVAFLAALPKAPSNYNPLRYAQAAKARRDWVLSQMVETGAITRAQATAGIAEPLGVTLKPADTDRALGYFTEEVRRELIGQFGEKAVYEGGMIVHTSFSAQYQAMADKAFHDGLMAYDRRHGWRGPVKHFPTPAAAEAGLGQVDKEPGVATWRLAAVTRVDTSGADIVVKGGGRARIPASEFAWAHRTLPDQRLGGAPRTPGEVVAAGDVIWVEPLNTSATVYGHGRSQQTEPLYGLRQVPDVDGGFVVLDPKTGRVFAMVGGWESAANGFNRVTQAWRQEGSAIKPLVYVTAMDHGYTPDSVVDDSPISIPQGPGLPAWTPSNYEGTSDGPSTLRDALIHSKNLVTARLATMIGMKPIAETAQNFDVMDRMPLYYSMALGAGDTTLLRLTNAYGMLDNGGHWLLPSMIDTVQDRAGKIVYQKGVGSCAGCYVDAKAAGATDPEFKAAGAPDPKTAGVKNAEFADNTALYKPTRPDPLVTPQADYDIVSMMQGVVQQGTGIEVASVGKPLAGKTGTTNDFKDAWFVGFSPNLAAGGFVGFDNPRTLGNNETGGHVAAPIFRDFMAAALKDQPATPFPAPPGGVAPVVASYNPGQQPQQQNYGWKQQQQNYGSTQEQPQPPGGAYADDEPGAGASQEQDEANSRGWYSYNQYVQQHGRRGQDSDRAAYPYPNQAGYQYQYQDQAPPSETVDGAIPTESQRERADDRSTRSYRRQPAYAEDDDPNAPARYRRYVPAARQPMPYGQVVPGPFWGPGNDR